MNATELLDQLREKVEALEEENTHLSNQLEIGRRSFGKAFMNGAVRGPNRPNRRKLTPREVHDIRTAYRNGMSQAELARTYEVNPSTISRTIGRVYHS
ncbi:helix-turn-helix DNA-binding domain protein [Gordonia phage LastResort]|uniref:HTH DNA binding domain protein n=2 Tax=Soupsvirus soups TaxID=1982563 RepID=A0A160DIY4_9CAUD|nr:HTH DNA binding protein [Gordonia phage KatherineG]YP_009269348.1 HTH DNA binding protein [Gordonia phage Soups]ASZ73927.1 HTH DNA binding protein [Gordonia phage ShayRa]AXH47847.1 helix-turn-helix DNA-binding domain protein [Gordonia phage LastResort]QDM56225.1 helix-turn-helix DNA-binding domain protein [Gordonia phage ReMo]QWS67831.1 helix-turn-helix DNA-binding domain protein [Gordonia phage DekHockey33]QZD98698.1 helix-turn-helix DNA-binding domain protein [Gordonia phage Looper]UAJ1